MKKRILFFACLCMLFSLGAKAQSPLFDYDVTAQNSSVAAGGAFTSSTQNGITISGDATINNDGTMKCLNFSGNAIRIYLTSATANISKVTVFFRGSGNSNAATVVVSTADSPSGTLVQRGSQATAGVTLENRVEYNLPISENGQKYIELKRTGSTLRVYRIVAGDSDYTLPLELLSFSAKPDALGKSVSLNWKTANEVNTQDFLVERRTDDTEFATVGTVLSKNVAGTHSYSFTDTKPVAGNSYYRLKQRDKDGKSSYSDIANVKIDGIALSLYPNPVSKELVVSHDYVKQSASLKVIGLDGKTHIKTASAVGSSSTTINVASLASGTYLLLHDLNGKSQSQKFIKK